MINTAEQRFVKGTEEYVMFNDFWKLCQSFWMPEDSDDYWKKLIDSLKNLKKPFCKIHLARGVFSVFGFVKKCVLCKRTNIMSAIFGFMEIYTETQLAKDTDDYWKSLHDEIENYVKEVSEDDSSRKIREVLALIAMTEAERKFKGGK